MKSLRLLHITDLHRKEKVRINSSDIIGDFKDNTIPAKYNSIVTDNWEDNCIKAILQWERLHSKIDAIICTGDLGDKGIVTTIEEGVSFLNLLCDKLSIEKTNLIICPGNHDLERDKGDSAFTNFETMLQKEGFQSFCTKEDIKIVKIKDISIFAINSCLGGTAQSLFIDKYKEIICNLTDDEDKEIRKQLDSLCQNYMVDYLDIPIIGNEQIDKLERDITNMDDNDSAIILMHHNPYPNKSVEFRPYCNTIDSGKTLSRLRGTNKNIFILHGHIHFEDSIITFSPKNRNNFVASIGGGALNNANGSMVAILEFFFTDTGNHILTNVYKISKNSSGFELDGHYSIYDNKLTTKQMKIDYDKPLKDNPGLIFSQLLTETNNPEKDDLLKVLLKDPAIKIDRKSTEDYQQWYISKH